jgi:WD40 repeat protein
VTKPFESGIQGTKIQFQYIGHEADIYSLDISRESRRDSSCLWIRRPNSRIWDMETGQNLLTCSIADSVVAVAVSPDGKFMAVAASPQIEDRQGTIRNCPRTHPIKLKLSRGNPPISNLCSLSFLYPLSPSVFDFSRTCNPPTLHSR